MIMLEKIDRNKFQSEMGDYLKEKRLAAELSQGEVSDQLGFESPQFISNIERGKCAIPIHVIRHLIKLYGINRNEFLRFFSELQMSCIRDSLSAKAFKRAK